MPSAPCFPCRPFSTSSPDMTHPHCIGIHAHVFFFLENIVFSICSYITNEKMVGERQPQGRAHPRPYPPSAMSPFCCLYTAMCAPYVTTPNDLHAARSIKNTYPLLWDSNPDSGTGMIAGATSSRVSGSQPSVHSALFSATYHTTLRAIACHLSHLRMCSRHPLQGWHLHLHLLAVT